MILINMLIALVFFCMILGVIMNISLNILSKIAGLLYLGLWYLSSIIEAPKWLNINVPKTGLKKIIMDLAAVIFIICNIENLRFILLNFRNSQMVQDKLTAGTMYSISQTIVCSVSLIVIFGISYFSKEDKINGIAKIQEYKLGSIWKFLLP